MIKYYFSQQGQVPQPLSDPKPGCLVYVQDPSTSELELLTNQHKLDPDLIADGLDENEAPRIETQSRKTYLYSRIVLDESEKQTTSTILIIYGVDMLYIITKTPFAFINELLENPTVNTTKRTKLLLEILAAVNLGYRQRLNKIAKRIWQIRSQLNKSQIANRDFVQFIDLEEDLNDFLFALEPMNTLLNQLLTGKFFKLYEDDQDLMEDLELNSDELITRTDSQLKTIRNIRDAYSAIATNNLNRTFKLMTSITILIGLFTLVSSIYGMNVALPLASRANAFWLIFGASIILVGLVATLFKKHKWF